MPTNEASVFDTATLLGLLGNLGEPVVLTLVLASLAVLAVASFYVGRRWERSRSATRIAKERADLTRHRRELVQAKRALEDRTADIEFRGRQHDLRYENLKHIADELSRTVATLRSGERTRDGLGVTDLPVIDAEAGEGSVAPTGNRAIASTQAPAQPADGLALRRLQ